MSNITLPDDFGQTPKKQLSLPNHGDSVLLHCCCAPCSSAMIEACLHYHIKPTLYFYNPNIHPEPEYLTRKNELVRFAKTLGLDSVDADYNPKQWFARMKGLEQEPERGRRCLSCFSMRLEKTAQYAAEHGFAYFTTTLATSRWKDQAQITQAALSAQATTQNKTLFWQQDWRKEGLSNRKDSLIKQIGFYNQQYCGCAYSLRDSNKWRKANNRPLIVPCKGENEGDE